MPVARALLLVLDSVGIGGAPDAAAYGDAGADTLGHIAEACARAEGNRVGLRQGPLRLPNLAGLGLGLAAQGASGRVPPGLAPPEGGVVGAFGHAVERAAGKDTPSGHWEIAGVTLDRVWTHFPDTRPAFPEALTRALITQAGLPGILGDRHASGTAVIDALGAEHLRTGKPICYTSADSVLQIAAHETAFGLERLYETCRVARALCDGYGVGRVIARPFTGEASRFRRTANRRDYSVPPPAETLLDRLDAQGRAVVSVGKIGDIFAHRGTGREVKAGNNAACLDAALDAFTTLPGGGLVFANLVDFDTEHGHRRDVPGYAAELEAFDRRVPDLRRALRVEDLCIITADHGNDPTWRGTEHTREQVPILAFGPDVRLGPIGQRATFADIGATLARHLGLSAAGEGTAW